MQYNVIIVESEDGRRLLMCRRRKEPFRGKLNFVGGKRQAGEDGETAARRELKEETALGEADLSLLHLMDLSYPVEGFSLEVYYGRLKHRVAVYGEENELCWVEKDSDFTDTGVFAGYGNIYHMIRYLGAVGSPAYIARQTLAHQEQNGG